MTLGYGDNRCQREMGHADWAVHFTAYLATSQSAVVREAVIAALLSSKSLYKLPEVVNETLHELVEKSMDDASPF